MVLSGGLVPGDSVLKDQCVWSDIERDYPANIGVPRLFTEQVQRTPTAIAMKSDRETLTYAHLNARANQLAHHLVAKGIGGEARVAVLLGRSVPAVVALLAVLKAGAAYVPLHPSYPDDRIRWLVHDAEVAVVLTNLAMARRASTAGTSMIVVNADLAQAKRPVRNLDTAIDPDQLAYMMYKSISTETPKGVGITHRDIVSLAADSRWRSGTHQWHVRPSPHALDAVTYEMCIPLLCGGELVIVPENNRTTENP
jgi:non-ribosomal peptide synthetase component F